MAGVSAQLLLNQGLITAEDLHSATLENRASGRPVIDILVDQGKIQRRDAVRLFCQQLNIPVLPQVRTDMVDMDSLIALTPERCLEMKVLPLLLNGQAKPVLGMVDPTDHDTRDDVRFIVGRSMEPVMVDQEYLEAVIQQLFPVEDEIQSQLREIDGVDLEVAEPAEESRVLDISELPAHEQAPIVALVSLVLKRAILDGASDIHLEPKEKNLRVRFRVDGVLVEKEVIRASYKAGVIARIKVLSRLDITEKRIPQDGAFTVKVDKNRIDFRVSTFPTPAGEKTVLRVLNPAMRLTLDKLGFPDQVLTRINEVMAVHDGIFLVTGPTGSGKSTTLYSLLGEMDSPERNIITLEDPIEYQLETITQGQANPKAGFTFASGLRAILRQDPDVILVGEIRDLETARIAAQASLTGHLVFSTLHTNSACEAVIRLQDMGVEPFMISATLRGALAQRLARKLCQKCRVEFVPDKPIIEQFERHQVDYPAGQALYKAEGCDDCHGIGYRGRMGVYEMYWMTEEARHLVVQQANTQTLLEEARRSGFTTMREDGLRKVLQGLTTLEEVYRVT